MSGFVEYIQSNGDRLLGISVYAQNVTSLIATIFVVVAMIFSVVMVKKKQK